MRPRLLASLLLVLPALALGLGPAAAQAPAIQWERTLGGSNFDGLVGSPFSTNLDPAPYVGVRAKPALGGGLLGGGRVVLAAGGRAHGPATKPLRLLGAAP